MILCIDEHNMESAELGQLRNSSAKTVQHETVVCTTPLIDTAHLVQPDRKPRDQRTKEFVCNMLQRTRSEVNLPLRDFDY